uniref:Uncharacterized protein n=1 Tax=Microviridae sp. ctNWS1 TaxID=2826733 RepID=A0A8S5N4R1_9VIRU|nr:MAG TPA: hypothetical protein [Microviridae sp. ctNWS1]
MSADSLTFPSFKTDSKPRPIIRYLADLAVH